MTDGNLPPTREEPPVKTEWSDEDDALLLRLVTKSDAPLWVAAGQIPGGSTEADCRRRLAELGVRCTLVTGDGERCTLEAGHDGAHMVLRGDGGPSEKTAAKSLDERVEFLSQRIAALSKDFQTFCAEMDVDRRLASIRHAVCQLADRLEAHEKKVR